MFCKILEIKLKSNINKVLKNTELTKIIIDFYYK